MMSGIDLPQPSGSFYWAQAGEPSRPALVCGGLEPFAFHLFTTRAWALGSKGTGLDRAWLEVEHAVGAPLLRVRQVHGAGVLVQRAGEPPSRDATADVIVTDDPSLAIAIQTADCVPILVADRRTGAVAAAHAGWRGLAAGVPGVVVEALGNTFGSRPADLFAAVGPAISGPRYEVGVEVWNAFTRGRFGADGVARWFSSSVRAEHWQFDGWVSARDQLVAAGVPPAQIFVSGLCTAAHPGLFCSYRRDGRPAGRMAAAIRCGRPRP
jgi:YfiH family protein